MYRIKNDDGYDKYYPQIYLQQYRYEEIKNKGKIRRIKEKKVILNSSNENDEIDD